AREFCAIIPLLVLMVWMGTFTQSFMPPIMTTNTAILGPIEARKEIQVKARPASRPGLPVLVKEVADAR
ncbi:MAG: hypothetical protein JO022_15675, partial [Acidobacteriaceae bacterium]|nr:hypothetical protein [Acidobacteriaceae bacterium]